MNKTGLLLSLLSVFLHSACGLDVITVTETADNTIEKTELTEEEIQNLGLDELRELDLIGSEEFEGQDIERDQVVSVKLASLVVEIAEDSDGQAFDFLNSVTFYAKTEDLDRVKVAELDSIPTGSTRLDFEVTDAEIVDYITAEKLEIISEANGSKPLEDTNIEATLDFDVQINLCSILDSL